MSLTSLESEDLLETTSLTIGSWSLRISEYDFSNLEQLLMRFLQVKMNSSSRCTYSKA